MVYSRQWSGVGASVACTPLAAKFSEQYLTAKSFHPIRRLLLTIVLVAAFPPLQAGENFALLRFLKHAEIEHRYIYSSLYTRHYNPKPEHNNDQNLFGFETQYENNRLWGFALFDNSFGQDSQYLYLGRQYRAFESDQWYYKLTGGLLHGYREPYEDKIPLNDLGIAPAIIPGIGYRYKNFIAEFVQLGFSAGMITVGTTF